jgi:hypothetical protein
MAQEPSPVTVTSLGEPTVGESAANNPPVAIRTAINSGASGDDLRVGGTMLPDNSRRVVFAFMLRFQLNC